MNRSHRRPLGLISVLVCWAALAVVETGNADTRRFEFVIRDRELASAERTIRVQQGDLVELTWLSDEAGELHLHGYDIAFEVTPAEPRTMTFEARATGRFPVTRHGFGEDAGHDHAALLYIEVYPD